MKKSAELPGFPRPPEQGCPASDAVPRRPPGTAWITDEAIADTRRVWSPYYGRELSDGEAVEILMAEAKAAQDSRQLSRRTSQRK